MLQGKTLILGHGRHGKDTVAEILRDNHGLSFQSSSHACLEVIYPVLQEVNNYSSMEEAYEDRLNNRALWKSLISLYNSPDKSALSTLILSKCDAYVGMRCAIEFAKSAHLFNNIIWVDASGRHPEDPSMSITLTDEMVVIDNNGTLKELHKNIEEYVNDRATQPRVVQTAHRPGDRITCRCNIRAKPVSKFYRCPSLNGKGIS